MNAHDQNSVFRAIKAAIEQPAEFSRKLSWDEQRALSPEARVRYWDWLFGVNEPVVRRRIRQELTARRDTDAEYERDRT